MPDPDVVTVEAEFAARPEDVCTYWVDADLYTRWMGRSVRLDPTPDGEYFVQMNDGFAAAGAFRALDPARALKFTWGWAPGAGERSSPDRSRTRSCHQDRAEFS